MIIRCDTDNKNFEITTIMAKTYDPESWLASNELMREQKRKRMQNVLTALELHEDAIIIYAGDGENL